MSKPETSVDTTETEREASPAQARTFGGLTAREAAQRSAAARREKAAAELAAQADAKRSFRERVGVSLSKLSQSELDGAIRGLARSGKPADLRALAALADQAFGRPSPDQGEGDPQDELAQSLTREQRAKLLAQLDEAPFAPSD